MDEFTLDVLTQAAIVVMPYDELVDFWNRLIDELEGEPGNEELQIVVQFVGEEVDRRPERHERMVGYEAICGLCWEIFNPHTPDDIIHGSNRRGLWCGGVGTLIGGWK